jgi:anti-sigma B factor antagonist
VLIFCVQSANKVLALKEEIKMAGLNILERQVSDFTVFDLTGDITFGEGSIVLRNAIRRALSESKKKFLLNLTGVGYIDSSGIGELVSGFIAINREGGQLRLSNLPQRIEELLTICKLLTIFDICENESETIGGYK